MKKVRKIVAMEMLVAVLMLVAGCDMNRIVVSDSGIGKKSVEVSTDTDGWTIEQKNIAERLKMDNMPGSIKHLYIISPYSGQVIMYSTVAGKVTSSGKRLTPTSVTDISGSMNQHGFRTIGNQFTTEVLQDDGTYGTSCEYIYWKDVQGRYHQHFFTGGQIIHISDQPLPIKNVLINLSEVE